MVYKIFFLVIVTTVLLTAGVYSSINAQTLSSDNASDKQNSSLDSTSSPKKSYGLRISSPVSGDQVLISGNNYWNKNGQNFTIQGFSIYDKNSSLACYVSVIANGVKPYQTANGTGPKGNTDYTTWKYTFSPLYTPLKEGPNKITSKLSCQPGDLVAYYSVNVTGSKFNGSLPNSTQVAPLTSQNNLSSNSSTSTSNNSNTSSTIVQSNQSSSTPTPPISEPITSNSSTSTSNNSNTNSSSSIPTSNTETRNVPPATKSMSIAIEKTQSGRSQSLVITVKDSATDQPIEGSFLAGNINDISFSGISNSNGEFTKVISPDVLKSTSSLKVSVTATADGYKTNKENKSFDLSNNPKSNTATSTSNSNINNGAKDMASKIAKDVQRQLSKQGINIPLPFGS
ncbi:MAG: hypothetical protein ACTHKC_03700 [Candidatus Nitrosocosmicus sp.]